MYVDAPAAHAQCGFDGFQHTAAIRAAKTQPILNDFELLLAACMNARVALLVEQRQHFRLLEVLRYNNWKADQAQRIVRRARAGTDSGENGFRRVAPHEFAATLAVQLCAARK